MLVFNVELVDRIEVAAFDFPNRQVRSCSPNQIGSRSLEQKIHLILLFLPNEAKDCNLVLRQIDIKKEEQKDIERQIDKEAKGQRDRVTE
jgi:hypothetical protein